MKLIKLAFDFDASANENSMYGNDMRNVPLVNHNFPFVPAL